MEENQSVNNPFVPAEERPQFLSVLCILTWICSGLMFLSTMWSVVFQPSQEEMYQQIEEVRKVSPDAADRMEEAFESQTPLSKGVNTGLSLIGLGLTVLGTVHMWQLKRSGFKLYLAGELLPYLGFFVTGTKGLESMGAMSGMSASAIAVVAIATMVIIDGVFVGMYAANLKFMNK
jgi:hypothetical protein